MANEGEPLSMREQLSSEPPFLGRGTSEAEMPGVIRQISDSYVKAWQTELEKPNNTIDVKSWRNVVRTTLGETRGVDGQVVQRAVLLVQHGNTQDQDVANNVRALHAANVTLNAMNRENPVYQSTIASEAIFTEGMEYGLQQLQGESINTGVIISNVYTRVRRREEAFRRPRDVFEFDTPARRAEAIDPLELVIQGDTREEINSNIGRITPRLQPIVREYYFGGYGREEIARRHDITVGQVELFLENATRELQNTFPYTYADLVNGMKR